MEATLHPCTWPVSPAGILSLLLELQSHPGHCQSNGVCGATGKTGEKGMLMDRLLTKPSSLSSAFEIPCSASKQLCVAYCPLCVVSTGPSGKELEGDGSADHGGEGV